MVDHGRGRVGLVMSAGLYLAAVLPLLSCAQSTVIAYSLPECTPSTAQDMFIGRGGVLARDLGANWVEFRDDCESSGGPSLVIRWSGAPGDLRGRLLGLSYCSGATDTGLVLCSVNGGQILVAPTSDHLSVTVAGPSTSVSPK